MTKGIFYKFLTSVGTGAEKRNLKYQEPVIEHNIPENRILNVNDFNFKTFSTTEYWSRTFAYISDEEFKAKLEDKLIFPSYYNTRYDCTYLGAVVVRCAGGDFITYLYKYNNYQNKIILKPIRPLVDDNSNYIKSDSLPNRSIKVFLTKEEFEDDKNKKKDKKDARRQNDKELTKNLKRQSPVFSFTTPKFKVVEVVKETAYLPDVKPGDVIYGEIPVIEGTDEQKWGTMKGIGTRTNWISLYINDKKVNPISPVVFPSLFFNNIVVEKV